MKPIAFAPLLLALVSCVNERAPKQSSAPGDAAAVTSGRDSAEPLATVPMGHAAGQFHTIPVLVNGEALTIAVMDTGIGIELISGALCERIGCKRDGEFTGERMSGQAVTIPLTRLETLSVGGITRHDVVAGVIDDERFWAEPQLEAFVGLPFFADQPFTLDGPNRRLVIESPGSLAARESAGTQVPVRVREHGPAIDLFVGLQMGDTRAEVMMDTGSRTVILDDGFAEALDIDLAGEQIRRTEGSDETGNAFQRAYTTLDRDVTLAGVEGQAHRGLDVMFQDIIHEGLVGTQLLERYVITYDVEGSRILVGPHAAGS